MRNLVYNLLTISLLGMVSAQNNYALEDLNSTSSTFGAEVGPSYYGNQVTIHYFGYYY